MVVISVVKVNILLNFIRTVSYKLQTKVYLCLTKQTV